MIKKNQKSNKSKTRQLFKQQKCTHKLSTFELGNSKKEIKSIYFFDFSNFVAMIEFNVV